MMSVATSRSVFSALLKGSGGVGTGGMGSRAISVGGLDNLHTWVIGAGHQDKEDTTTATGGFGGGAYRFYSTTRATAAPTRGGRGGGRRGPVRNPRGGAVVVPTMELAQAMPLACREMNNSDLVVLGRMGNGDARKEILIRHIMTVDKVNYETANATFKKIASKNREGMWLITLPYKVGITVAVTAALASFPMVFDIHTVTWFNEFYVTADVPEPKDLETPLEVGSWSWNWMEPPLGQISFVLLCMQYTRSQIENIGIRPYTAKIMEMRANKLAKAFPQYNAQIVKDFSEAITFYDDKHGIRDWSA